MKKLFSIFLGIALLQACGNDTTSTKTEATPGQSGTENVNGNVPDSTNSIDLNKSLPVDSSKAKDSVTR